MLNKSEEADYCDVISCDKHAVMHLQQFIFVNKNKLPIELFCFKKLQLLMSKLVKRGLFATKWRVDEHLANWFVGMRKNF